MSLSKLALCLLIPAACLLAQPQTTAWKVLKPGFADKNPLHRRQAITATGSIGTDPEAVRLVEAALKDDKDSLVRATAAAELGQMHSRSSIPALRTALNDPSGEVAFAAAKSLWGMDDKSGRGFLEDVIAGQQKAVNGGFKGAVVGVAPDAILGPFDIGVLGADEMLRANAVAARMEALNLLSRDCDHATFKLLELAATGDKTWAEKAAASRALGRCGNPDAIPMLEHNLSDANIAVRFMSAAAIVRLSRKP